MILIDILSSNTLIANTSLIFFVTAREHWFIYCNIRDVPFQSSKAKMDAWLKIYIQIISLFILYSCTPLKTVIGAHNGHEHLSVI